MSASKKGLFDIVKSMQPITRAKLIEKVKYGKRGGEAIINVITALDLLKCINGNYYLTKKSENFLTSSSAFTFQPMIDIYYEKDKEFEKYYKAIDEENYVISNAIVNDWSVGSVDEKRAAAFTQYMQCSHVAPANGVAKTIDFAKFGIKTFLDVGGGSGCFSY
jgi:hypothetical protein